jgi:hypothetical protein
LMVTNPSLSRRISSVNWPSPSSCLTSMVTSWERRKTAWGEGYVRRWALCGSCGTWAPPSIWKLR